jgi:hypothetical protein
VSSNRLSVDNITTIVSTNAAVASLGITSTVSPTPPRAVLIVGVGIAGVMSASSPGTGLIVIVVIVLALAISARVVDLVVLSTVSATRIENRRLVNRNYCRVNRGSATVYATVASVVTVNEFRTFIGFPLSFSISTPLRERNNRNQENHSERKQ